MSAKSKNKKGVALITVFFVITVLLVLSAAFIGVSVNQNRIADIINKRAKAAYIAEAGLSRALYWFRSQGTPPTGDRTDPWGGPQNLGDGSYSVFIKDLGGAVTTHRYKVTSTGTCNNVKRILADYLQVDNYARYLWFTDAETYGGTTVWFWSLDHLNGPMHTNANYNIKGTPQFDSDVESVADYIRFYNNGNNINLSATTNAPNDIPVFQKGVNFGVESTTMPHQALNLRTAATSGGLSLTGDTTVVLNNNGTMNVTNSNKSWNNKNMALPANGALFVNSGALTLSGTLKGQLSAGASGNILIPSNITYATDPRTDPTSTDVLGIVSESNVRIDDNAPYNVEIDGCIMSLNTSFYLENYSTVDAKGTLTVYGGIIQDQRGPVGTFNGSTGQKLSGYSKNYLYDARLLSSPPPFVPTTGDYVTLAWEED